TPIHTLPLHDALPIFPRLKRRGRESLSERDEDRPAPQKRRAVGGGYEDTPGGAPRTTLGRARDRSNPPDHHAGTVLRRDGLVDRSEEHTSELQSLAYL